MCRGLDWMATWGPFQLYYSMILCFKEDSCHVQGLDCMASWGPFQLYYSMIVYDSMGCSPTHLEGSRLGKGGLPSPALGSAPPRCRRHA